jgi:hypothetical protein
MERNCPEGKEIDDAQQSQKNPRAERERWPLKMLAPQNSGQPVERISIPRYKPVEEFRDHGDARKMLIEPEHPCAPRNEGEGSKHRVRSAERAPIRQDQLHGTGKSFTRNLRKLRGDILEGLIADAFPGEIAPTANPKAAKATVPIVNQNRFVRSYGIHALNPDEEIVSCPVARRRGILLELGE